MPDLPLAPHFPVCLQILTLATKYARAFDMLDDPSLSVPEASERTVRRIKEVRLLGGDTAEVATASETLPMSLIDHTDRTVRSTLAQLQVLTAAAAENLERAADPASLVPPDTRMNHVETARDLLATASADLMACAERVAAEMERYRSTYSVPEAGLPLTAEQFQVLRLTAQGAVSVDEEGQPWVGLDKSAVRTDVLQELDRQDLVAPAASAAWAGDVRFRPTPMGMLVLATSLGRPAYPAAGARSAPCAAPAGTVASVQKTRR